MPQEKTSIEPFVCVRHEGAEIWDIVLSVSGDLWGCNIIFPRAGPADYILTDSYT